MYVDIIIISSSDTGQLKIMREIKLVPYYGQIIKKVEKSTLKIYRIKKGARSQPKMGERFKGLFTSSYLREFALHLPLRHDLCRKVSAQIFLQDQLIEHNCQTGSSTITVELAGSLEQYGNVEITSLN